jgi:hypothetical protein
MVGRRGVSMDEKRGKGGGSVEPVRSDSYNLARRHRMKKKLYRILVM